MISKPALKIILPWVLPALTGFIVCSASGSGRPRILQEPPASAKVLKSSSTGPTFKWSDAKPMQFLKIEAVNNHGQGVGSFNATDHATDPFSYQDGKFHDLSGVLGDFGYPSSINDSGDIAGARSVGSLFSKLKRFTGILRNGKWLPVPLKRGQQGGTITINNRGDVLGFAYINESDTRPFLYSNGRVQYLQATGFKDIEATSMNDSGEVVGMMTNPLATPEGEAIVHGFLWRNGKAFDLGPLCYMNSVPLYINNRGEVAGTKVEMTSSGHSQYAFIRSKGKIRALPAPVGWRGATTGLNNRGWVMGYIGNVANFRMPNHAVVWIDEKMYDLNDVTLNKPKDIELTSAEVMNDRGELYCSGLKNGESFHFLISFQP